MSKEIILVKNLSKILPLYDSVRDVYDKCMEEPCRDCDFKSFGPSCQAMRVAVKLQDTIRDFVKTELTNFCNDFMNTLYETEETTYNHKSIILIMDSALKKYLEENNKK